VTQSAGITGASADLIPGQRGDGELVGGQDPHRKDVEHTEHAEAEEGSGRRQRQPPVERQGAHLGERRSDQDAGAGPGHRRDEPLGRVAQIGDRRAIVPIE
jgi:hypothetical protein